MDYKEYSKTLEIARKICEAIYSICGGRVGFSIGVSWSRHGIDCGGVLPRREAKALADRIYELLNECENTEEEDYAKWNKLIWEQNKD